VSVDAKDELLRDIEAELEKASELAQVGANGLYYDGYRAVKNHARAVDAVNNLLRLLARAKVNGGVRW
jgi:hypothetical protein